MLGNKNLKKPQLDMPVEIVAGYADSVSIADREWWNFYTDSTLCYIIRETLAHNRDLLVAGAKVEELRQLYGVDKLNYLPTLNGIAGATHETNDYYSGNFKPDTEVSFKLTLNWEIDLWGGLSAAKKKSAAQFVASVEDRRAMEMTLTAEAATAYFNLMALENELAIVKRTLITREEALERLSCGLKAA